MKYSELRKKFSNKLNFVKPLYNRVKFRNRVQPKSIVINIERKLHGRGFYVNREFSGNENVHANRIHLNSWKGKCVSRKFGGNGVRDFKRNYDVWNNQTMLSIKEDKENRMYKGNKYNEGERDAQDKPAVCHKALMTWLQVYPAPSLPNEGVVSIVFRCVMCQLGLAAFLVTWTVIWLLMISYFEEPHELKIAHDFTKEQNQLVINLATELRQTPWSRATE